MANDPESLLVIVVKNCLELAAAKQLRRVARSTRATKMAKEKKMPRELRSHPKWGLAVDAGLGKGEKIKEHLDLSGYLRATAFWGYLTEHWSWRG